MKIHKKGLNHKTQPTQGTNEGLITYYDSIKQQSLKIEKVTVTKKKFPAFVLLFVALWFILRGDLFYVLHCVILFLCFSVILALRLPRLEKRELILVLFVRLFDLCLFGFVGFLFLLVSGRAADCDCDCGTPWTFLLPLFSQQF